MALFPVFLKLKGRPCLVVGASTIAQAKIRSLLEGGAKVRVIGPQATKTVQCWARTKKLDWLKRAFEPADLEGMFLVVVATSSRRLNELVSQEAARRGVLCNTVDDPDYCDFYYGAVVRRGPLQIAVSTSGASPALAQRLKQEIARKYGAEYGAWVQQLIAARRKLLAQAMNPKRRQQALHRMASPESFAAFLRNDAAARKRR